MQKVLVDSQDKKYGSFTVTPKLSGNTVYFNFNNRGGSARYNLTTGEFLPVKGRVGRATEQWLEDNFIANR